MHVLCYQPSCLTCFSSTDFLEIYGRQDFVLALETDDNLQRRIRAVRGIFQGYLFTKL
jgi:hypothetical protein